MPVPSAIVVIPTLESGKVLKACLASLSLQTRRDFAIIIVDNGGQGRARPLVNKFLSSNPRAPDTRVIDNERNAGYGEAVNQAWRAVDAPFVAVLNDDTTVAPEWLDALLRAAASDEQTGMCACRVILSEEGTLDSAGMLLASDGSSKQRGHGSRPEQWDESGDCLLPSGSAALYRRELLEQTGGFDPKFFLYCEDTDLGLRAIWAGWHCRYVAQARVWHHYSRTAGRVSPLKAFYVERNRWLVVAKNFPLGMALRTPFATIARYFHHLLSIGRHQGSAASDYVKQGNSFLSLVFIPLRALFSFLALLPYALRERKGILSSARIPPEEFESRCRQHSISLKEVAQL